jgi:hypothetical protein
MVGSRRGRGWRRGPTSHGTRPRGGFALPRRAFEPGGAARNWAVARIKFDWKTDFDPAQ